MTKIALVRWSASKRTFSTASNSFPSGVMRHEQTFMPSGSGRVVLCSARGHLLKPPLISGRAPVSALGILRNHGLAWLKT
jgi:hypothetical protein